MIKKLFTWLDDYLFSCSVEDHDKEMLRTAKLELSKAEDFLIYYRAMAQYRREQVERLTTSINANASNSDSVSR